MRKLIALTVFCAAPAYSSDPVIWEKDGDWTISINLEDASRCYAFRDLEDGSQVQIGTEPTLDGGYFAIYNSTWSHIDEGELGEVEFNFGTSRFGGEVVGKRSDGALGGYVFLITQLLCKSLPDNKVLKLLGGTVQSLSST